MSWRCFWIFATAIGEDNSSDALHSREVYHCVACTELARRSIEVYGDICLNMEITHSIQLVECFVVTNLVFFLLCDVGLFCSLQYMLCSIYTPDDISTVDIGIEQALVSKCFFNMIWETVRVHYLPIISATKIVSKDFTAHLSWTGSSLAQTEESER